MRRLLAFAALSLGLVLGSGAAFGAHHESGEAEAEKKMPPVESQPADEEAEDAATPAAPAAPEGEKKKTEDAAGEGPN